MHKANRAQAAQSVQVEGLASQFSSKLNFTGDQQEEQKESDRV